MKKIIFGIMFTFLCICSVSAFDNTLKVYDYAQELSNTEEKLLKSKIDKYIEKYNMDMVIVTVKHHENYDTNKYANDFYTYNDFDTNGIILVIDLSNHKENISIETFGQAKSMYQNKVDVMINNINNTLNKGYYYAADKFIDMSLNYENIKINKLDNNSNTYLTIFLIVLFSILFSILITSIIIILCTNKKRNSSITTSFNHIKEGTLIINVRQEKFVTTHTKSNIKNTK